MSENCQGTEAIDTKDTIHVDIAVIGGGPGGYTAAFRAADLGLSVGLIESAATLGGVCVNEGCIPSKTLLHATSLITEANHAQEMGISFGQIQVDIETLRNHKVKTVKTLTTGIANLADARGIKRLQGKGTFKAAHRLEVVGANSTVTVSFGKAIIATGSSPVKLPKMPEHACIWDSSAALDLKTIPDNLLIIGGGIIGLEMAQVYAALGSNITIVEASEQLIPAADKDILQPLLKSIKKHYQILTKTKVVDVSIIEEGVSVTMEGKKVMEPVVFDSVLVAVGRQPNTANIGLERLGITLDSHQCIPVDSHRETSSSGVYAIGDVVAGPMLAHKATHEGKIAAESAAGLSVSQKVVAIPSVAYTSPELAWVGLTEKAAKAQGVEYTVGKIPWLVSGRAQSVNATNGVTKALFDKQDGVLLGASICGENAGELIHEAVIGLTMGTKAYDIAHAVHAHPTLSETFAFAAELVEGTMTDMLPPRKR
ncbi:dihydrolipoyl dehydrogenase [Vibrio sp. 10N.286.49.C2]|uniref:dihydrolipoyl dehydrogenase n=1 Tax=unclassified Vibrio TaxID=2614977 RepID=UPI000C867DAD|nr:MULTISPECIES: dihydrolipoyl dehydrogenase [unclassified Vibrio]PMH36697.1 dihydrolipoyl dehydrogenase [Vibrio sp. 10N.286.49.C2]PMH54685.1 dihydrolipoyl dehydrogenase [Vibrio sp. 10N.286.49.B1]PMH78319.1 dihydrolipoyl dehydrogenase [Vibrio sp. 10N.286.48.B7]